MSEYLDPIFLEKLLTSGKKLVYLLLHPKTQIKQETGDHGVRSGIAVKTCVQDNSSVPEPATVPHRGPLVHLVQETQLKLKHVAPANVQVCTLFTCMADMQRFTSPSNIIHVFNFSWILMMEDDY